LVNGQWVDDSTSTLIAPLLETNSINSGTGNYDSFLRLQASGTETGFSTDVNGNNIADNKSTFTHSIQLGSLAHTTIGGVDFIEFRLDLNETNNANGPNITLSDLKIYISGQAATLADFIGHFTSGFQTVFSLSGPMNLVDTSNGSGTDDYGFLIPVSAFAGGTADSYVTLVSTFTGSDGGFEEWRVLPAPSTPTPLPTAELSIDKFTNGLDLAGNILVGEAVTWTYQVINVGHDGGEVSNVIVTDDNGGIGPEFNPSAVLAGDGIHNTGDTDLDGRLDVGETWLYTASGVATAGAYTNTGVATGHGPVNGVDTPLSANDQSGYFGANPQISINKTTTGISSAGADHTLYTGDDVIAGPNDGISVLAGSNVTWTYTVTNAGNVALSSVSVTDSVSGVNPAYVSGDTNLDGKLDLTETWIYTATGTAVLGGYSNVGTASGSFTDTAGHIGTDTDTNASSYTGTFTEAQSGRTQGFWGSHTEAWDGIHTAANDSKYAKLVGTDLHAAAINPLANGDVLLGDVNHSGAIEGNEVGLLVSYTVANSILSASTSDHRLSMLQQAIAAQLNIDNYDVNPGDPWGPNPQVGDKIAGDMITEAVQWLKTYGGAALSDGVLNTSDYSTSTGKFLTALTAAQDTVFWNTSKDVDGTTNNTKATGEDLKNVLMAFNTNKLVTSNDDQIGWNQNTTDPQHIVNVIGVTVNSADAFWDIVHDNIGNFGLTWHGI
jgi:uncharacterized repeat protein (TIGR01451 family)